jgi:hypothetical protein
MTMLVTKYHPIRALWHARDRGSKTFTSLADTAMNSSASTVTTGTGVDIRAELQKSHCHKRQVWRTIRIGAIQRSAISVAEEDQATSLMDG